jgi:hypothetical protein
MDYRCKIAPATNHYALGRRNPTPVINREPDRVLSAVQRKAKQPQRRRSGCGRSRACVQDGGPHPGAECQIAGVGDVDTRMDTIPALAMDLRVDEPIGQAGLQHLCACQAAALPGSDVMDGGNAVFIACHLSTAVDA